MIHKRNRQELPSLSVRSRDLERSRDITDKLAEHGLLYLSTINLKPQPKIMLGVAPKRVLAMFFSM